MPEGSGYRSILVGAAVLAGAWMLAGCSADDSPSGSPVHVTIDPDVATVVAGTSQTFAAAVTGTGNPAVTWSLEEGGVGGEISATGVYRAPRQAGTYHVAAASGADPSRRGRATVTVILPQPISVAITSPETPVVPLPPGGTVAFLAAVKGAGNRTVRWTIDTGRSFPGGSITVDGVYTAPALEVISPYFDASGSITVVVRARSVVDPTKSATRPVVIQQASVPVTISPPRVALGLGGLVALPHSQDLTAFPTWEVNDEEGGDSEVGTISALGGYRAPFRIPEPATVIIDSSAATNQVFVTVASRFLPPETIPVHTCLPACPFAHPAALAAADFNGDGLSDLATANPGSGTLSLLIAADSSHLAAPYRLPVGSPETSLPRTLLAALLSGDGPADLAAASADLARGAVRTRLGVGDGTFSGEAESELPVNADPVTVATGVFDGDSIPDLVVADASAGRLHLFQGLGGGLFSLRHSLADEAKIPRPTAVAVADFDRNGRDDLAVAAGDHTVAVWLTNADGSLRHAQTVAFQPDHVPVALVTVDLNLDAAPDLVVTLATPPGVSVVLNTGASQGGIFGAPAPPIEWGSKPAAAAAGDFNQDGFSDIAVADRAANTVTVYFGDGHGALVRSETYLVGATPLAVTTGDFNGDGWHDIAVANSDDDTVYVFRNRGGPTTP